MEKNEIQPNVQEWIENQATFQAQVESWTAEKGCPRNAMWIIRDEIDDSGSQPVEDVVIDVALKVNLVNLEINPIMLHCTCRTQKNEESIRTAVVAINENLLEKIENIFPEL